MARNPVGLSSLWREIFAGDTSVDIEDRQDALRADRQGIGLTLDVDDFTDTLGDEPTDELLLPK